MAELVVVLAKLKAECWGLQTLVRNHHFVVEAGMVRVKVPGQDLPRNSRAKPPSDNSARHWERLERKEIPL